MNESLVGGYDAGEARSEVERRQEQTIREGLRPWPWSFVLGLAAALVAIGAAVDLEMLWLVALIPLGVVAAAAPQRTQLRPSGRGRRRALAATGVVVLAVAINGLAQFFLRAADWPAPNTWGALAGAVVVVATARPLQALATGVRGDV